MRAQPAQEVENAGRLDPPGPSGGPGGNEQLTAATGAVLLGLLAVLGVTIVQIGQLTWLHLFLGLLLIGPVGLKMASTGYRFLRYYTGAPPYLHKGPPELWLRLLAPLVVFSTIGVFASGVVLLFLGPLHRNPWVLIHKATFIIWLGATGLHVLGHLLEMPGALRGERLGSDPGHGSGRAGRAIVLAGAVVAGAVLAIALIPDFSTWTAHLGLWSHHHDG